MTTEKAYQMFFPEYPDVVNARQMCEMLGGISTKTAYRLLTNGAIASRRIGRSYRIPKINILLYLNLVQKSEV